MGRKAERINRRKHLGLGEERMRRKRGKHPGPASQLPVNELWSRKYRMKERGKKRSPKAKHLYEEKRINLSLKN